MRLLRPFVALAAVVISGASARAQPRYDWVAFDLHGVAGSLESGAEGVSRLGIGVWGDGPALVFDVDTVRASLGWGAIFGADDSVQCGAHLTDSEWYRGALWFGTAESMVDMHPPDADYFVSEVSDVCGTMAVGYAGHVSGNRHAAVWLDLDRNQMLDLHPGGRGDSQAYATDGSWQGGTARTDPVIWRGSAESMVVMTPSGYRSGIIYGMAPGSQVGGAIDPDNETHAIVWHDTPESFVDMHPAGARYGHSYMYCTSGDIHAGEVTSDAAVWFGDDPESYLDLDQFVPGNPGPSRALDIDVYDGIVYIAGYAIFGGRSHAIVWIGTPVDGLHDGVGPGAIRPRP